MRSNSSWLSCLFKVAIFGTAVSTLSCSTRIDPDRGSCGYSAHYETNKKDGNTELSFYWITAEIVNGRSECGFQYIRTRVEKAEINGTILEERAVPDGFGREDHVYIGPGGFDPRKSPIIMTIGGHRHRSDPKTVKEGGPSGNVKLMPE